MRYSRTEEQARLAALRRLQILDTPPERRFDDIVELAAQICDMPIAIMNLVDGDRQWGKALVGVASSEAPREASFCSRTIASSDDVMVVEDTHEDPRFADNPMVVGDPHLRFYAGAPLVDRDGHKVGTVCVCDRVPRTLGSDELRALRILARQAMDQMELRLALDVEREQVRSLRELDELRDQFIATVSHELRTPLTSIRGWLDLLIEEAAGFTRQQCEALERVDRNVDRLGRLVEDLLDLTRSDAGVLAVRHERVNLSALARDAVAAMAAGGEGAGLAIEPSIADAVEVTGDTQRLAQVIDNVCSNAVKYTPAGGRIRVELVRQDGAAVLRVCDTGIGVPEAERVHLFERFFRASTATEHDIPGTGLGLAISKAIVERHGGTIALSGGDGAHGTAVAVTLPLARDQ